MTPLEDERHRPSGGLSMVLRTYRGCIIYEHDGMGHAQMPFSAFFLPHLQLQSFEKPCARSAQCSSGCSGDRSTSGLSVFSALCWRGGEVRHGHRPLLLLARKPGSSAQFNARLRLSTYAMDLTLLHRSRMRDWALGPVISLVNGIPQRECGLW